MTKQEEALVIRQVLDGDPDKFELLVRAYEKSIYNLALRMLNGNPQDALDASQEAFFRAYRALPTFRGESKFSVWLYRLAGNVCLDMLRRQAKASETSLTGEGDEPLALPDVRFDPQTELEKKALRQAVRQGLDRLEPVFRQALILRDIQGLSYEEIAQVTGLEPGTVKSRIFRARRKLAAFLMGDGNFSDLAPSYVTAANKNAKGGGSHGKL